MHVELCAIENHFLVVFKVIDPVLSGFFHFCGHIGDNILRLLLHLASSCRFRLILEDALSWCVFWLSLGGARWLKIDSFRSTNNFDDSLELNGLISRVIVVQVIEQADETPFIDLVAQVTQALQEFVLDDPVLPTHEHLLETFSDWFINTVSQFDQCLIDEILLLHLIADEIDD